MEKVIITGGAGAIGLHLTKLLVANFYEVIIFTRNPKSHPVQNNVDTYIGIPVNRRLMSNQFRKPTISSTWRVQTSIRNAGQNHINKKLLPAG
jgi:nucleoside-diphosphate-sugar epimerase